MAIIIDRIRETDDITADQFVVHTEIYTYSKNHFEAMKELGELALLELYNNISDYSDNLNLSESESHMFIIEAANEGIKETFKSKFAQKVKNAQSTTSSLSTKLWHGYSVYLTNINNVIKVQQEQQIKTLLQSINRAGKITLNEQQVATIEKELYKKNPNQANDDKNTFSIVKGRYYDGRYEYNTLLVHAIIKIDPDLKNILYELGRYLAPSFEVEMATDISECKNYFTQAMGILEGFVDIMDGPANIKNEDIKRIENKIDDLIRLISKAKGNSIKRRFNTDEITRQSQFFANNKAKWKNYFNKLIELFDKTLDHNSVDNNNSTAASENINISGTIQKLYVLVVNLQYITGRSMKALNRYAVDRRDAINKINTILALSNIGVKD